MDLESSSFLTGFLFGTILVLVVSILLATIKNSMEYSGYRDKMLIEYHCPDKEYERNLFWDVVNGSGVQTNFIDREISMDSHHIKIRLTNPQK